MTIFKLVRTLAFTAAFITCGGIMNNGAVAHQHHGKQNCKFLPENNLNIPVGYESLTGGIDEKTFDGVIEQVSAFYKPIITKQGGTLKVNHLWTDGTVNANASRSGKTWVVNMYGGLARHGRTTADGFTLVLCHELGHHLGGFPRLGGALGGNSWAANEGQADYFATMKCARRVWENDNNEAVVAGLNVPQIVKDKCSTQLKSQKEILLCERSSMAGLTLGLLLWDLSNGSNTGPTNGSGKTPEPKFDTPSTATVSTTDNAHPKAQCRVDTYFNGSFCGASFTQDFGQSDAITGACAIERGDKAGYRPMCWYKPKK